MDIFSQLLKFHSLWQQLKINARSFADKNLLPGTCVKQLFLVGTGYDSRAPRHLSQIARFAVVRAI